jgi:hypothetical protein
MTTFSFKLKIKDGVRKKNCYYKKTIMNLFQLKDEVENMPHVRYTRFGLVMDN